MCFPEEDMSHSVQNEIHVQNVFKIITNKDDSLRKRILWCMFKKLKCSLLSKLPNQGFKDPITHLPQITNFS